VNDNVKVYGKIFQIMRCFLCYKNIIDSFKSQNILGKCIITSCYEINGITTLKKHMDVDNLIIAKSFEEEM
jgi:hypothetical protein